MLGHSSPRSSERWQEWVGTLLLYDEGVIGALRRVYGDGYTSFMEAVTRPGSRLYVRVNTLLADPNDVLDSLRSRGVEVYRDELLEEALYFPVRGPFRVEELKISVVADKYAAESVYLGSDLYAPGVLKCDPSVEAGAEVVIRAPNGVPVANGVAMMSCKEMLGRRRGLAVKVTKSVYATAKIRELEEYREGLLYPQSLAAMYVTRLLSPKPREIVVDACAAPGGKTGHTIELTRGKALVIAFDVSLKRLQELKEELGRLRELGLVEAWRADSRYLHIDFGWIRADKVLLDPPCTALGVRPKLYDVKRFQDVVAASKYQLQFLKSASRLLRVGGVLVYSTCTVTMEENEDVIDEFLRSDRCFDVDDTVPEGLSNNAFLKSARSGPYFRFHPHLHDTSGYFVARLVRKC